MSHIAPSTFPIRIRRFQSYSMTPLDGQILGFQSNNRIKIAHESEVKVIEQNRLKTSEIFQSQNNLMGNSIPVNQKSKLLPAVSFNCQASNKFTNQSRRNENCRNFVRPSLLFQKQPQNLNNSVVFQNLTLFEHNPMKTVRTFKKQAFLPEYADLTKIDLENIKVKGNSLKSDRAKKEAHIPSFLLNKKNKRSKDSSASKNQGETVSQAKQRQAVRTTGQLSSQSTKTFNQKMIGLFQTDKRRRSFMKQSNMDLSKSSQLDNPYTFSPISTTKISFSKATASTLCTSLPRQQSRATFKDFEDMQMLKQAQSAMEDSQNLTNQFQNLFQKQQSQQKTDGLAEQIAQLFSDQQAKSSQEFNQELKDQLEQLF